MTEDAKIKSYAFLCPKCGVWNEDPHIHWVRPVSNPYYTSSGYMEVVCGRCDYEVEVYDD